MGGTESHSHITNSDDKNVLNCLPDRGRGSRRGLPKRRMSRCRRWPSPGRSACGHRTQPPPPWLQSAAPKTRVSCSLDRLKLKWNVNVHMCLLPILILLELNKHFDTIHDINFFTRIFLHTPSDNNTCMPDRDQHDPCDDDVYSKCGRHLPDSRAEPGFSVPHN